ncbi:hypothetical protein A0H81_10703 [Grifola frondosa]|uniref:Major facilitator superfamily (MFS) profile domain-containing protein n=1 Tax=Grifola frondosa TaxID=5627 RepID=A0A1C7LY04_GRIFR|nr:hypothetical protein A0H81_10703 [Grifola frondosa]
MSAEGELRSTAPTLKEDPNAGDIEKHSIGVPLESSLQEDFTARYSHIDEAKLVWKIDLRVIPVLCILYLLAFLDRVNISNATLFGLKDDLHLGGDEYNTALVVFFVPYVLFEIPSNAAIKRLRPHLWLSLCMFLFGIITVLQGLTQNFSGIVATRFFLGLVESGVVPACYYLISMWYKRAEAQKRYSLFFSGTSLAGAFGGLLASAIGKMDGMRGYHGWRWIFILEGTLTAVISISLYFAIPDFPEEVKWLTAEEKKFVKARLYEDVGHSMRHDPLTLRSILNVFKDYKIIVGGFMYFGLIVPSYGLSYFIPTIVQNLGHGSIRTQLLTVPIFACAFAFAMVSATASDYFRHRFLFIIFTSAVCLAGFIILLVVHHDTNLQYGALFLAAMGTYSAMPLIICWFTTNLGGHHRRAVGTAWQIGFGNIGGIISAYSFLAKDAPDFIPGRRDRAARAAEKAGLSEAGAIARVLKKVKKEGMYVFGPREPHAPCKG